MSSTITTAVFGLVGVAVGAAMQAITARTNRMRDYRLSLADYRREKRETIYLNVLRHVDKVRRMADEQPDIGPSDLSLSLDPDLRLEFDLYANALIRLAYFSLQKCWARKGLYDVLVQICHQLNYADIAERLDPLASRILLALEDQERVLNESMQNEIIGNEFWQIQYRIRRLRRRKLNRRRIAPEEVESIDKLLSDLDEVVMRRLEDDGLNMTAESARPALGESTGLAQRIKQLARRSLGDTNS